MRRYTFATVTGLIMLLCMACTPNLGGAPSAVSPDQMTAGGQIYNGGCFRCHGVEGEGDKGPAFAGNANLAYTEYVIDRILWGYEKMPSLNKRLSDDQVAAVSTYIRNSFGNNYGPVRAERVAARRR